MSEDFVMQGSKTTSNQSNGTSNANGHAHGGKKSRHTVAPGKVEDASVSDGKHVVHNFHQHSRLKVVFSVPTGNFGDILAGYYCKKLSPVFAEAFQFVIASNDNDILPRFFSEGKYDVRPDSKKYGPALKATISPSMDIQVSSNFERFLYDINVAEIDKKFGTELKS